MTEVSPTIPNPDPARSDAALGLEVEGIYRISGRKAGVQLVSPLVPHARQVPRPSLDAGLTQVQMIQDIEKDEERFEFSEKEDIHSISNVLKQCESPSGPRARV